ncbi:CLUMA_CG017399, isoform A [Clunio marinus]|uniref:CLUMA_CG017399, isoform A n=1 Tax=Clunio marinus TaxID=568069 RepID=A0A1J1IVR4_9DIPT|nr:CLUMA_CG017399, isoform A [Clunio marinus]
MSVLTLSTEIVNKYVREEIQQETLQQMRKAFKDLNNYLTTTKMVKKRRRSRKVVTKQLKAMNRENPCLYQKLEHREQFCTSSNSNTP